MIFQYQLECCEEKPCCDNDNSSETECSKSIKQSNRPSKKCPVNTSVMFFKSDDPVGDSSRYMGINKDVPLGNFESVSIVVPAMTVLQFMARIDSGVVPGGLGDSVTFTLYYQTSSISGSELPVPGGILTIPAGSNSGSVLLYAPINLFSTLAVRIDPSPAINVLSGASAAIKFEL
jgi:hypothetical protein